MFPGWSRQTFLATATAPGGHCDHLLHYTLPGTFCEETNSIHLSLLPLNKYCYLAAIMVSTLQYSNDQHIQWHLSLWLKGCQGGVAACSALYSCCFISDLESSKTVFNFVVVINLNVQTIVYTARTDSFKLRFNQYTMKSGKLMKVEDKRFFFIRILLTVLHFIKPLVFFHASFSELKITLWPLMNLDGENLSSVKQRQHLTSWHTQGWICHLHPGKSFFIHCIQINKGCPN